MAFKKILPVVKIEEKVTVAVRSGGRDGNTLRAELYLSRSLESKLSWAKRVSVSEGTDDDAGKLLVEFGEKGEFRIEHKKSNNCIYVRFPVPNCAPANTLFSSTKCAWRWLDGEKSMEITLPVAAWLEAKQQEK